MPPDAFLVAPLLLSLVLATAGMGKLRSSESGVDPFIALDVPRPLRRSWIVSAHPWTELALAVGLIVTTGILGRAVAVAVLTLMVGYWWLVIRAVHRAEDVTCDCFGALGSGAVTRWTVARNSAYVGLAVVAAWMQFADASPVDLAASSFGAAEWWWLGAVAVTAMTVAMTLRAETAPQRHETEGGATAHTSEADDMDYVRSHTPAVEVGRADGSRVNLRELSAERAQLLLFVSRICGWCEEVVSEAPTWRREMPQIDVRLVYPGITPDDSGDHGTSLYDEHQWVRQSFGISGYPAALALGIDGMLAGGPVQGHIAVAEFVSEVREQLTGQVSERE